MGGGGRGGPSRAVLASGSPWVPQGPHTRSSPSPGTLGWAELTLIFSWVEVPPTRRGPLLKPVGLLPPSLCPLPMPASGSAGGVWGVSRACLGRGLSSPAGVEDVRSLDPVAGTWEEGLVPCAHRWV